MSSTRGHKVGRVLRSRVVKVKAQVSSSRMDSNVSTAKRKGAQKGKANPKRPTKKNEGSEKTSTSSDCSLVARISEESQRRNIYQFNVALKLKKPKIWKMIELEEDGTFHDLHLAIERTFGRPRDWLPHLYEFRLEKDAEKKPQAQLGENSSADSREQIHQALEDRRKSVTYIGGISSPFGFDNDYDAIYDGEQRITGREAILKDLFVINVSRCMYTFDLGESFVYKIVLEKILPVQ